MVKRGGNFFTEGLDKAKRVATAAWEKQAQDIVVLDVKGLCDFSDYFVLCSGESQRQLEAIRDEIDTQLGREGVSPLHREGDTDSGWLLLDFGEVVVHIFAPEKREYYGLDRIWDKAVPILRLQ